MRRIVIPIDISARELNGKLWLATNLVSRGYEVIIGDLTLHLNLDVVQPDISFSHGARKYQNSILNTGCTLVYMDTEGGVFSSEEAYARRIRPFSENVHTFFVWGEVQGNIAKSEGFNEVVVTGNPRFDLCQPNLRKLYDNTSQSIKDTYGDYILINTSFSIANHASDKITNFEKPETIKTNTDWQQYLLISFIDLIKELEDEINQSIVIRPHPSENHDTYKEIFKNSDNIYVEHEYSVRPWIHSADVVLHSGCTTGIESIMMDTPTIAYIPRETKFADNLPNSVSNKAFSQSQIINMINEAVNTPIEFQLADEQQSNLKSYFNNIEVLAAPKIADSFEKIEGEYDTHFSPTIKTRIRRQTMLSLGHKNISRIRRLNIVDSWYYAYQKYPYISTTEIKSRIEFFTQFVDIDDIDVSRIRRIENTFKLSP